MKRLYVVVLSLFACCGPSRAQFIADNRVAGSGDGAGAPNEALVCALGSAPAAPWKKQPDQVFGHIRGSRLARMRALAEDLVLALHDSVFTEGSPDPVWHGEYFSAANDAPQMRFGVSCIFPSGDGKSDRGSDLTLFANDISPLLGTLSVNGQKFVTLKGLT
ncbi:MAG TPA: hypothetical protein VHE54_06055, partial [Puia sp.]|nr:hypothetical protein [Puia sp.]